MLRCGQTTTRQRATAGRWTASLTGVCGAVIAASAVVGDCAGADAASAVEGDCASWDSNGYFHTASVEDVAECVRSGTDLSARGTLGRTPLHIAAMHNDSPFVITALVAAGADPRMRDQRDHTPLHSAAMASTNPAVIAALLKAGADPAAPSMPASMDDFIPPAGQSSFGTFGFELWGTAWYFQTLELRRERLGAEHEQSTSGHPMIAGAVLEGENPKIFSLLVELATEGGHAGQGRVVHGPTAERVPFEDDLSAMTELLNILKERELRGIRPVHVATRFNRSVAVLRALVDGGADVNVPTVHDYNALHVAACFGDSAAVVAALAEAGVDPNGLDAFRGTPLHAAASVSNAPALVKALLAAGADVEARDEHGRTPLHRAFARYQPSTAVVEVLIAAGADTAALDSRERKPEDIRHW